jgi:hypothetical protein
MWNAQDQPGEWGVFKQKRGPGLRRAAFMPVWA